MRKTWIIIPLALIALVLTPILAYTHTPSESHATAIILPTPSATPTYPACITEDGAGQALCWWDAQTQGNGKGTSVVSGDCAPSIVGEATVPMCVNLHARDSVTITNEDGSSTTIPNGADLVAECTDEFDLGIAQRECFRAWLNG